MPQIGAPVAWSHGYTEAGLLLDLLITGEWELLASAADLYADLLLRRD